MMLRKALAILLLASLVVTSVFASDTYESGTLYWTNSFIDDSDEYVATERELSLEVKNAQGNVIDSLSSSAYYSIRNYGNMIERSLAGDTQAFAFIDQIYDGYVLTPFNDAVCSYDKTQLENVTVDGTDCFVYEIEVAVDEGVFTGVSPTGRLAGGGRDDENGDLVMTVYINSETGAVVRQIMTLDVTGKQLTQAADFITAEVDGVTVNVPASVVTEGVVRSATASQITNAVYFTASETFSSYQLADGYHDAD